MNTETTTTEPPSKTSDPHAPRCVTVARAENASSRSYPYWAAVEYVARPRARDGVLTWRRVGDVSERTRSEAKARRDAEAFAAENCTHFLPGIRQGATRGLETEWVNESDIPAHVTDVWVLTSDTYSSQPEWTSDPEAHLANLTGNNAPEIIEQRDTVIDRATGEVIYRRYRARRIIATGRRFPREHDADGDACYALARMALAADGEARARWLAVAARAYARSEETE